MIKLSMAYNNYPHTHVDSFCLFLDSKVSSSWYHGLIVAFPGPEVIKLFSSSTQLSMIELSMAHNNYPHTHVDSYSLFLDSWYHGLIVAFPGPEVIKLFSCSTQLSMNFQWLITTKMLKNRSNVCFTTHMFVFILLINVKMPTLVGILTFISKINFVPS